MNLLGMTEERILPDGVREVSGTDEPLRAMMAGGEIPYPPPLAYNEWIAWRSREGRRPRLRAGDPRGTARSEESLLWRTIMEEVHGPDWRTLVRDASRAPSREPVTEPVNFTPAQAAREQAMLNMTEKLENEVKGVLREYYAMKRAHDMK